MDGPAVGVTLACARTPCFLRVVQDTLSLRFDALDLPGDTPGPSDVIHVYRRIPGTFQQPAHVCTRGRGCSVIGFADYEYVPMDDTEPLRSTETWREWAGAQSHPEGIIATARVS